jgi:uncharacterized damage-inducible protein DinB
MKELLVTFYDYGCWANQRLLEQAAHVTDAQWRQPFSQGYRTLADNLAHLVSSDWRWYMMGWRGEQPPQGTALADLTTLDAIRSAWERLYGERRAYLASLTEAQLHEPLRNPRGGPAPLRWQGILTCALHGTHHRSEIAAMLTDCGHSPGDLDLLFFCLEHNQPPAPAIHSLIITLYDYTIWANGRLLAKIAPLTDAQRTQVFSQGYKSIFDTLIHTLAAETLWFARWRGASPRAILSRADVPTLADAQARWEALIGERRAFLSRLSETQLAQLAQWTSTRGEPYALPLWQIILHCANHSMQHRAELAAMLTDLGQSAGDVDFVFFAMAKSHA